MRVLLRPRGLPAVVAAACLMLGGCAHTPAAPSAVDRHQTQWQSKRLTSYDFVYFRSGMAGRCSLLVHVRDRRVVSATAQHQCPWAMTTNSALTIDALFSQTKSAYRHNDRVTSDFEPAYGFPTEVSVDPNKNAVDDEYAFGASSFQPR